ncbi:MAG: hypothetical protein WDN30_09910 [Pararobbsia sp.]
MYAIHTRENGGYLMSLVKVDHLDIGVSTREREKLSSPTGLGYSALLEAGLASCVRDRMERRAGCPRVIRRRRIDDFTDRDRVQVQPRAHRTSSVGIGARVARSLAAPGLVYRPYLSAGLTYSTSPPSAQTIGGLAFMSAGMSSSWETSAGVDGRLGKRMFFFVDIAVRDGVDHGFRRRFRGGRSQLDFLRTGFDFRRVRERPLPQARSSPSDGMTFIARDDGRRQPSN